MVSKYTSLKLLLSYLSLLGLMFFAVWFLYNQQTKLNNLLQEDTTNKKYLLFTDLIKEFYETDNYSKVALQTNKKEALQVFTVKNAMLIKKLDFLKPEFFAEEQGLLDTLKIYLNFKEKNIIELLNLQNNSKEPAPLNEILDKIKMLEVSKGKLFIENFVSQPEKLTPYQRRVAEAYIEYLNLNVPKDESNTISFKEADSILQASKAIILKAQKQKMKQLGAIKSKEIELLKNELFFTKKLSDVIQLLRNAIEIDQEKLENKKVVTQNDTLLLMRNAALACVVVVLFFFFLLSFDFLKNKNYRKELEIQKKKAERLSASREQLMATVSHDIKAPLQLVMSYSEQLLKKENQFANREQLLKIKSASLYIEQLVSDLLDFVRMEQGKIQVNFQNFDLNELLEETAQSIADLHQKENVKLHLKIEETEEMLLNSDFNKLRQILYNLIGNAYKFTATGSITITTVINSDRLQISVRDTGVGIPEASFDKIFNPFTQENNQVEKLYGGTGLGLSISKRLVQLLKGTLTVESKLEEGSNFIINLPLSIGNQKQNESLITLQSCVILDDDASQLTLTKAVLAPYFEEVNVFTDGYAALEFINSHKPSIIFSDIQMPLMDGYNFLAHIKNNEETKQIPVIAISGNSPVEDNSATFKFDAFLTKPYTVNQLLGILYAFSGKKLQLKTSKDNSIYEILKTFLGDDATAIQNFITHYRIDLQLDIQLLKEALEKRDLKSAVQIIHKLQTMIGQLKNDELAKSLFQIEQKINENVGFNSIENELRQSISALEKFLKVL